MVLIYKSNRYYASHVHVQWRLRALAVDPNIPRIIYYIFTVLFCSRPKLKKNAGQNPCLVLRYLILKCGILDFRLGTISENVILHLHILNLMPCGFKLSLWHRRLIWQTDWYIYIYIYRYMYLLYFKKKHIWELGNAWCH